VSDAGEVMSDIRARRDPNFGGFWSSSTGSFSPTQGDFRAKVVVNSPEWA
jgi:hypothetical protein